MERNLSKNNNQRRNNTQMKEDKIIITTMNLNFIVAIAKLIAGILFSFSTLIADSIQSFTDFITDITSLIANRIGKRRANKTYPFGYGQVYAVANLFTGALLFLIGIFVVYQIFFFEGELKPNSTLFVTLGAIIVFKSITVYLLQHFGKSYKSELMIESSKESKADLISTLVVLGISVIVLFEDRIPFNINFDKLGSIGIAIYVFYISTKMICFNIKEMLTNTEENSQVKDEISKEITKIKKIELKKLQIIKMTTYYSVFIKVSADDKLTIKQFIKIEKEIKQKVRAKDKHIRFIDIELV